MLTFNLYQLPTTFKTAYISTNWKLHRIMNKLYEFFKDEVTRHSFYRDGTIITLGVPSSAVSILASDTVIGNTGLHQFRSMK